VRHRNQSLPPVGRQLSESQSEKACAADRVSFQTGSSASELPNQLSNELREPDSDFDSEQEQVFSKTQANAQKTPQAPLGVNSVVLIARMMKKVKNSVERHKKNLTHPILPRGMTKQTLVDNSKFDNWFHQVFRRPSPTHEDLVRKKVAQNQLARTRRLLRDKIRRENGSCDAEESISVHLTSQSENESQLSNLANDQEAAQDLQVCKLDTKMQQIDAIKQKSMQEQLLKLSLFQEEPLSSDEELRNPQAVQHLI